MDYKPYMNDSVSGSTSNEFQPIKRVIDTNNSASKSSTSSHISLSGPMARPNKSQKVPFTLKYQLNIRKNNKTDNNNNNSPGPHSGVLSDLTYDQDKGQFL